MEITRNIRHPEYSIQHSRRGFSYVGAASRAALPRRPRLGRPTSRGFTLIELLVVITIIGILASLITVAAIGALKAMRETEIKTNVSQLDTGMMEYKNKTTAFPPNCQTDGTAGPLDDAQILSDLKKHLKQAFPRHQEPDDLIRVIAGFDPANTSFFPEVLDGGISAGEALVFWLGGFSSDPKYPISGEGGPSYRIQTKGNNMNRTLDPIETREWVYPFEITQVAPRAEDGYFDESNDRFVEYRIVINGQPQDRRINFWQYTPRKSPQPYLYFDTSRHPAAVRAGTDIVSSFDPPAATEKSPFALHVHALKKASDSAGTNVPIEFVNPDKFQIIHCGDDDAWDEEAFERMSAHGVEGAGDDPADVANYLLFPTGPFIGEVADTIVNFTSERKIEDAQP